MASLMIQIYNTLNGEKTPFTPLTPGQVRMYVCGPTVYSDCHIGHTMGPVLFDAVARWFAVREYDVRFVNNITDIEDKIIKRSQETGEPWQSITERYTAQYNDLLAALNVTTVTDQPKCTEYISEMVTFIENLIAEDRAYVAADGVYFAVEKQPEYGKLSGRKLEDMKNDDTADSALQHRADFALWKLTKPDEPSWPSPWGEGRPGWHIECSVMSSTLLGDSFDIHGGGEELKFPHHENEIAQSEAHGHGYAQCWMHNGLCQYEGRKISKSDPRMRDPAFANQFQAKYLIETYGGEALRFHILRGHYRRPQEFKPEQLESSRTTLERLRKQIYDALGLDTKPLATLADIMALDLPDAATELVHKFVSMMDDDFNTGAALSQLFPLAALGRKSSVEERSVIMTAVYSLAHLLGIFQHGLKPPQVKSVQDGSVQEDHSLVDGLMNVLIELRTQARAQRDFATADQLRDQLGELGIIFKDSADGTTWERRDSI